MKPIEFKQQNITFAKDQPEYLPLPAYRDEEGQVISCWGLSFYERIIILFTGKFWFRQLTFNDPLQPQLPQVKSPFL